MIKPNNYVEYFVYGLYVKNYSCYIGVTTKSHGDINTTIYGRNTNMVGQIYHFSMTQVYEVNGSYCGYSHDCQQQGHLSYLMTISYFQ
jgi:hypothetical protein